MLNTNPDNIEFIYKFPYPELLFEAAEGIGSIKSLEYKDGGLTKTQDYALLDPKHNWTAKGTDDQKRIYEFDLNQLVSLAVKHKLTGLFHRSSYHRKSLFFILAPNVPEEFRRYVMFHEVTESRNVGVGESETMDIASELEEEERQGFIEKEMAYARKYPHMQGCMTEMLAVFNRGEEFAQRYAEWVVRSNSDIPDPGTYFNQLCEGFLGRNDRDSKNPLAVLVEFYVTIEGPRLYRKPSGHQLKMWPWIQKYWPNKVLEDRIR